MIDANLKDARRFAHVGIPAMDWFTVRTAVALAMVAGSAAMVMAQASSSINLTVTGLRNANGTVRCGLYNTAGAFPKAGQEFRGVVAHISGLQATCVFRDIPAGTYAIAFFHAEQNETRMQFGLFGKPMEGYGFSNNASGSFGPPSFSDAAFDVRGGSRSLQARVQY